ncbi:hypothetical protein BDY24DRAFT_91214 [Mrakia frigida]|uniref:uncharacterized protein n=1 Tax=Mrakia frigida TaxID=29902 RepID=UPI003FCC0991
MLPSSLSHKLTPFLPHLALLFLSTRSLGFSPSPFLTPFLVCFLLHLTTTSSFLSLLPFLSLGISLSYYLDLHSSSVILGSRLELAVALGLMGLVFATGILGLVSGWKWVERRWLNERAGREGLRNVTFPIVWSLGWMVVGRASPMGRQGSWTPTHGFLFDSLSPLVKIWGPAVIDLVAGALAVLLLKALHPRDLLLPDALLSSNGHQHQDLVRFEEEEDQQQRQEQVQEEPYRDDPSTPSQPRFLTLTNGLLLFLAFNLLPSFLPSPLPSPQPLSTHTPLSLACILPPSAPASSQTQSDLDRFLSETRRVASSARVLLWPEGAIQVENQASFEEAIKEVGVVSRGMGVWIGVGVVGRWRLDGEREEGEGKKKGNGMVLVGPTGEVVGGYRKVKVVPSELSHFISVFESEKN